MNAQPETLTIQQVAEATGLTEHTLRYYERIGLIHPIPRAGNTHRRYTTDDVGWIQFLLKLRAIGMPIQDMQRYAELQRQGDVSLPERVAMLKDLETCVVAHIDELQEHLRLIRYKIEIYGDLCEQQARLEEQARLEQQAEATLADAR
ncbi:MAG: MerR family transcriptional regulator [Chloroflexi bacterium]|nr:MerR family transcriptional regulator [Chloroflexota bacterium]